MQRGWVARSEALASEKREVENWHPVRSAEVTQSSLRYSTAFLVEVLQDTINDNAKSTLNGNKITKHDKLVL